MSIFLFFLLGLISAAVIFLPLYPQLFSVHLASGAVVEEIDQAVQAFRAGRTRSARLTRSAGSAAITRPDRTAGEPSRPRSTTCSACGRPNDPADRFCVGCGAELAKTAPAALACPACGASYQEGDQFCVKCGHVLTGPREA